MNWFKKVLQKIKDIKAADPCNDPRCKGCAHIDGPICPYTNECSAMIKKNENNYETN